MFRRTGQIMPSRRSASPDVFPGTVFCGRSMSRKGDIYTFEQRGNITFAGEGDRFKSALIRRTARSNSPNSRTAISWATNSTSASTDPTDSSAQRRSYTGKICSTSAPNAPSCAGKGICGRGISYLPCGRTFTRGHIPPLTTNSTSAAVWRWGTPLIYKSCAA